MSLLNGIFSSRTMAVWSLAAVFLLGTGSLSLQAQEYTPLPGLRVSDGRSSILDSYQLGNCINLSSSTITTHTSKWQRREGATWVDVPGTERDGVCAYSTTIPGEYRLVAEISIGGQRGFYSSENTFTIEGMAPPPVTGGPTYYFPHLAVGASWQTTITYINYSSEEVTCQTDFLSDDGTPLMVSFAGRGAVPSRTDVLPPGGSVHQETNVGLSAPLAPGWARATCSGPVKASLLFRQHNSAGVPVAEAAVNAATVPATRFVTFAEQGESKSGTGVAYANPSDTSAMLTFTAKDADGETLDSSVRTLLPGGHEAQNMALLFGLPSFTGSLEVTSTEPIVSLSLNFEAAPVFSSLPPGELDAAAQGLTTYYFPHLAVGASWQTTITYINYSPQEVSCTTEFLSDQGGPLMVSFAGLGTVISRTDVLPPQGSVHQETNVGLSAPLAPGWARATCSGPVKASLLFRQHNSAGVPIAEAAINAARVPATRFVTFAEQGEGKSGTGVAYANPSDTSAMLTFTAKDADGETLDSSVRTLLPGGHEAQNMTLLFGLPSFTGSLEVTSTEPIVSLSLNFEAAPVFSSLPSGELHAAPDVPGGMLAPANQAAFNTRFVGKRAATNIPTVYADFVSPGRFRETAGTDTSTGSYTYQHTGSNTGTLTFNYDDGDRCTTSLTFDSTTSGTATFMCDDGLSGGYTWHLVEIPGEMFAPANEAAFNSRMVGKRLTARTFSADFMSSGRFTESGSIPGSYSYSNTGPNTGTLTLTYDRGNYGGACTVLLTFASATTGTLSYTCRSGTGSTSQENWSVSEMDTAPASDAVTIEITECSGNVITLGTVLATIRGTVQAHRSVSSAYVTGTVNGQLVRRVPLGFISAGQTETFTIIGTISTFSTSLRCEVSVEVTALS